MSATKPIACAICIAALLGCATRIPVAPGPRDAWVPVGRAAVDPVTRTVIVTGFVNQVEGLVEYLACGAEGKRHESVFVLEAAPADLQAALLLLGARAGKPMPEQGVGPPRGTALSLDVQFERNGEAVRVAAGRCLRHTAEGPLPARSRWIFTGSVLEDGVFRANEDQSLIATYWDPWAIVNLGEPIGATDDFLAPNREVVPPVGTPVTFLLRVAP